VELPILEPLGLAISTRPQRVFLEVVIMGILTWIVFGLIAGVIAKLIMPGRDGGGFILTCVLGIVGAVVGGWLATMFGIGGGVNGFNLHSFLVAVVGSIVVLVVFRLLRRE
jgi:uncharacterized membrane protein YeaQ/YmgE (transglycosylase-associated protein family)